MGWLAIAVGLLTMSATGLELNVRGHRDNDLAAQRVIIAALVFRAVALVLGAALFIFGAQVVRGVW